MANSNSHNRFVEKLKRRMKELNHMREGEVHVFTVNANYGRYKIVVGPIKKRKNFPVEIEGEIHHLFVSPHAITANPSRKEVMQNLKHTVIVRDLSIHLNDPTGQGKNLALSKSVVKPREYINFAGEEGTEMMNHINSHGRLSMAAYRIIQNDILKSMKKEKKRAHH